MTPRHPSTPPGDRPDLAAALWPRLAARLRSRRRPFVLGLSGLQGSGKSTLAARLVRTAAAHGVPAVALSLDDFYYGRRERLRLARALHPLFATRGVPGTHEVDLLRATLAALTDPATRWPLRVPRFDKGRDTRVAPSRWPRVMAAPRLIVLEGWCLGVHPQSEAALRTACNALERRADADGRWRRAVNRALRAYLPVWRGCDALWLLQAPDFAIVRRWRGQAERARSGPQLDPAQLRRFIAHFERLSRHALATLPARADLVLRLDARRRIQAIGSTTTAVP